MIKILVVTHGNLAEEFLHTAEIIIGKMEGTKAVCLQEDESLKALTTRVEEAVKELSGKGEEVLVLTDLFGGTPSNAVALATRDKPARCLAGVNLPILLEALLTRQTLQLDSLVPMIIKKGSESLIDIKQRVAGV